MIGTFGNQDFRKDQSCAPDVRATYIAQNTYAHPCALCGE